MSYDRFGGIYSYPSYGYGYGNRYGSSSRYGSNYYNRWGTSGDGNSYTSPYNRNYRYGRRRRRPNYWERNRPWYNNYRRYRNTRSPSPAREETRPPTPPPEVPEVPEVPEDELAKELFVKDVDLHIGMNAKKHRTDEYTCTQGKDAELIVRRGDKVKMTITFDRPYNKEKNDLKLCFSLGPSPKANKGTLALFEIDESGKEKFGMDEWGANLTSRDDAKSEITVMVSIPANCIIGEWSFFVRTISEGKSEDGKPKEIIGKDFQLEDDITILFNPWCKDDPVYMSDGELLEEYVLNENGSVWRGSYNTLSPKPWNYGQFETDILDASLSLIRLGFGDKLKPMSDPVKVSRMIAKMVNANNDNGVLIGRWGDDYSGGEVPWSWVGSLKILRKWIKDGPVKYGQCWVFACVTTTVCRALGIPCRTVTNFESAHDTNGSNTVETYFKPGPGGFDVKDEHHRENDSIWNFHVWNEVWMARNDLQEFTEHGWQVIDATPQESSDGYMQCGPCPVRAIKNGVCTVNYDCGFIFTEVNGDEIHWITYPDGSEERKRIIKDSVGKNISTRKPGEKTERLDVTNEYKYKEGSKEERIAVMKAHETARFPNPDTYANVEKVKPIKFDLILRDDIMIGSIMPIKLVAKNEASRERTITKGEIIVSPAAYTGHTGKDILKEEFGPVTLKAGEEKIFEARLHPDKYLDYLVELANIAIVAEAQIEPIGGRDDEEEFYMKRASRFRRPDLKIKSPKTAKLGDVAMFTIILENPLDKPLTGCKISMESVGFDDFDLKDVDNIKPKEFWKMEFPLKTVKAAKHSAVYFSFECGEIPDISGYAIIKISA